jgi:hypothetical protein
MAKQILSEEFRRMQKLAGLSEVSGEDMGDNMYGITKEFKFGSEPGGPFKLELFSNGDMGISDGDNYLGLTNKDAKELSEILKQIMGKVNEAQSSYSVELLVPKVYFNVETGELSDNKYEWYTEDELRAGADQTSYTDPKELDTVVFSNDYSTAMDFASEYPELLKVV